MNRFLIVYNKMQNKPRYKYEQVILENTSEANK